jgi:hypothetical protein
VGNTFLGGTIALSQGSYPNNTYSSAKPTANVVEVRPNAYEPGRAHVIVYNWQNLGSVAVDLSGVLAVGSSFEVRNAQNFYGPAVLTGTYAGGKVSLPMSGLSTATPVGHAAPASSAPAFNAFVVLPRSPSPLLAAPGNFRVWN